VPGNSVESHRPSPRASGGSLPASSRKLPTVFNIELLAKTSRASISTVHGGSHTTIAIAMVSQDVTPLGTIAIAHARGKGFGELSNLTHTTINKPRASANTV
jgi:hypothetical protein